MAVYLLHFDRPFGHARHYLGWAPDHRVAERIAQHGTRHGSRLMWHVAQAGIGWTVARVWRGADRKRERQMKANGHAKRCPICNDGWRRPSSCRES